MDKEKDFFYEEESYKIRGAVFSKSAFTFIELLIVIGIVVILASVTIPNFFNYRSRLQIELTAKKITVVLRNAQDNSISQEGGSPWGVYFENPVAGTDFFALFSGTAYNPANVASKILLDSNIQFINPAANSSTTIIFSAVTGLPLASANIIISLANDLLASSTITVDSNGRIRY